MPMIYITYQEDLFYNYLGNLKRPPLFSWSSGRLGSCCQGRYSTNLGEEHHFGTIH